MADPHLLRPVPGRTNRMESDAGAVAPAMTVLSPHPALARFVYGYWLLDDRDSRHLGWPVSTAAFNGAVLTVNIGERAAPAFGPGLPAVSLLGAQSAGRSWFSWPGIAIVMVPLTPLGLARLFSNLGAELHDRLAEFGALLGDAASFQLAEGVDAAPNPKAIAATLDRWLLQRLERARQRETVDRLALAMTALRQGSRVEAVADWLGISRRQLLRLFAGHVGVGPREYLAVERFQASLQAVQRGKGDPLAGYADQAHQIRDWQRRAGTTPGRYARMGRSSLAAAFVSANPLALALYL